MSDALLITPGHFSLDQLRLIHQERIDFALDPACQASVAASQRTVASIIASQRTVYGINTGFGKLATVRIDASDLDRRQRNIVLSHAAGTGAPLPTPIVRLMIALKIASLGQGASGIQPKTLDFLETLLATGVIPVVPSQGSVGASGDLAPLAHMAAVMIGVGEVDTPAGRLPAVDGLAVAGLQPLTQVQAQVARERRIGVVDRLVLANHAAQFARQVARARLERRIFQDLVRLHGESRRRHDKRKRESDDGKTPHRPYSAGCNADFAAGFGAPMRKRRSDSDSAPPSIITTAPSQISSTNGL